MEICDMKLYKRCENEVSDEHPYRWTILGSIILLVVLRSSRCLCLNCGR